MDLAAIKAKLDALQDQSTGYQKIDYSKLFWKPEMGKQTIRIVPSAYEPSFPFTELKFHYVIGKFPLLSLSNFGKQDPVEEFIKELKKTSDKDNWALAGKLTPKTRIFAPVIVRGEEDKGVRLWGFGVTIYKALLALAEDEDIGDFTDVVNGWDLVVEQAPGKPYPETSVRIKPKQSPLSADSKQVEMWLKDQPNPIDSFNHPDYEFIKKQLQGYLTPGEETTPETKQQEAPKSEAKSPSKPKEGPTKKDYSVMPEFESKADALDSNFSLQAAKGEKSDAVSKFDSLFDE